MPLIMDYRPLLNDKLIERLVQSGPELDKIEPMLSPPLREALVDLQRNAADAYAAGDWKVPSTGETITVPESSSTAIIAQDAQQALGGAYLGMGDQGKSVLKTLMQDLGLNPSMPKATNASGHSLH